MSKDGRKNSAAESGMRGGSSPVPSTGSKTNKLLLPNGAEGMNIRPAVNGFSVFCDFPPKSEKHYERYIPPKQYVIGSKEDVVEYIEKELGVKDGDEKK